MEGAKILCKRVVELTVVNISFIELYKLHIVSFFFTQEVLYTYFLLKPLLLKCRL